MVYSWPTDVNRRMYASDLYHFARSSYHGIITFIRKNADGVFEFFERYRTIIHAIGPPRMAFLLLFQLSDGLAFLISGILTILFYITLTIIFVRGSRIVIFKVSLPTFLGFDLRLLRRKGVVKVHFLVNSFACIVYRRLIMLTLRFQYLSDTPSRVKRLSVGDASLFRAKFSAFLFVKKAISQKRDRKCVFSLITRLIGHEYKGFPKYQSVVRFFQRRVVTLWCWQKIITNCVFVSGIGVPFLYFIRGHGHQFGAFCRL